MAAKKSLGQHFLQCVWVAHTLIAAAELTKKDTVLEIGPGNGALTRPLAAAAGRVIAVEKDEALADTLASALTREKIDNVNVAKSDILRLFPTPQMPQTKFRSYRSYTDLNLVWGKKQHNYKVVANIPYYLTGRLIRLLLESPQKPSVIALTVQKEVAERMAAKPPHMNLLTLSIQAFGKPEIIKIVPASCFSPKPKVDSAIIRISDISDEFFTKNALDQNVFFRVIRGSFGQKRKQAVNSLTTIAGDKKTALEILRTAGINPKSRPEELTLEQWAEICRLIAR